MGLISITFSYTGYQKAETFRFYQRILRGFLRWHRTRAVWLKGIGKRKAHLIIHDALTQNVLRMFLDGLNNGGYFQAQHENLATVLWEAREKDPETVGYLSYSNVELGDPDEIFCPQDSYQKISIDVCRGASYDERCYSWDGHRCVYPQLTRKTQAQLQNERKLVGQPQLEEEAPQP